MKYIVLLGLLIYTGLSEIYVVSPEELKLKFENSLIISSLANFGNPPYGSSIIGHVYYAKQKDEHTACMELDPIDFTYG